MRAADLPNLVTGLRVLLLVPIAWMLWRVNYPAALVLVALACLSDAVDGGLARQFGWQSRFGALADPIADKVMVTVLFVGLTWQQQIPIWVTALVLGRDLVILAGATAYRLMFKELSIAPTWLSKINTAMQFVGLIMLLLGLCDYGAISAAMLTLMHPAGFWLIAFLSLVSGLDYVITWSIRARRRARATVRGQL